MISFKNVKREGDYATLRFNSKVSLDILEEAINKKGGKYSLGGAIGDIQKEATMPLFLGVVESNIAAIKIKNGVRIRLWFKNTRDNKRAIKEFDGGISPFADTPSKPAPVNVPRHGGQFCA